MDYSDQVPQQRAGFPRAPDGRGGPYYDRSRTITDEEMNDISQQNPSGSRTGTGQGMDGTEVLDVMHEVGGYGRFVLFRYSLQFQFFSDFVRFHLI